MVVGYHSSGIKVHGRLSNVPDNKIGLVLSLIPSNFQTLGGPPSFDTVTRDVYQPSQEFEVLFVLNVLIGVASFASHLHKNFISHGDLYAHNILVNDIGFPLLGNFDTLH